MEERIPQKAIGVASHRTGGFVGAAVTIDGIRASISAIRIVYSELSVIENVKYFSAKLQANGFFQLDMFKQGGIEVGAPGIPHGISSRIPEGETLGGSKSVGIPKDRAKTQGVVTSPRPYGAGARNDIWVRAGPRAIGYASVVKYGDSGASAAAIDDAERCARLDAGDTGKLPSFQEFPCQGSLRERRWVVGAIKLGVIHMEKIPETAQACQVGNLIHVADIQEVPLVEIRWPIVRPEVIRIHQGGVKAV